MHPILQMMLRMLSSYHDVNVISQYCFISWQVSFSCCRARAHRWEAFTVQAKRDRKTLDFTCVLTENHHKVNLAVLWDLSKQEWNSRPRLEASVDLKEEVHLYMAIPGKLLLTSMGTLCLS